MKMRKGFTLVELLIVIVIIGVLASAMLLSSGSATDSAVASKIVSNLRTMKAAVVMYRGDNNGVAPTTDADVAQYLGSTTLSTGYLYDWTNQLAKYDDSKHTNKKDKVLESQKVRDKLAEIATKEKNLYKADGKTLYTNTDKIITMKL